MADDPLVNANNAVQPKDLSAQDGKGPSSIPLKERFDDYRQGTDDGSVVEEGLEEQITGLEPSRKQSPTGIKEQERDGQRRSWLALGVLIALTALLFLHYGCVYWFVLTHGDNAEAATKPLESIFNAALPVLSGFAGTAFVFYFKDRQK